MGISRCVATWPALALMVLMALAHAISIVLFAKGFLLARLELSHVSTCADFPGVDPSTVSMAQPPCSAEPAFDRTVLLMVDALRYDFVFPERNSPFSSTSMPRLVDLLHSAVSWPYTRPASPTCQKPPYCTNSEQLAA